MGTVLFDNSSVRNVAALLLDACCVQLLESFDVGSDARKSEFGRKLP